MRLFRFAFAIGISYVGSAAAQDGTKTAFDISPEAQRKFVEIIAKHRDAFDNAANDMQAGAQRAARAKAICALLKDRRAKGWTGYITTLSSNGDGLGVLSVQIGEDITAGTWNNALSDIGSDTLIPPDSEVFQQASALSEGAAVSISGQFIASKADCVQEQSLTLSGSMSDPEFSIKFSAVQPLPGVEKPKRKSFLKSLFD